MPTKHRSPWIGRNQSNTLPLESRFWEKVKVLSDNECWEWQAHLNKKGYGRFRLDDSSMILAHRLSWILFKGNIPDDVLVLHECDNRKCVNPKHLFLGTHDDNMQDMVRKGRAKGTSQLGEHHPMHKLTEQDVKEIRNTYSQGTCTYFELANTFQVSYQTIGDIITRKRWKHVQ